MPGSSAQASAISAAIDDYLSLLDKCPEPDSSHLSRLARALDNLVAVYNQTADVEPDGEAEEPRADYGELMERANAAFPELGFYAHVHPDERVGVKSGQGWAQDDLADIAGDLLGVRWHLENSSPDEAIWHFRWGFQYHWGIHLFSLRNYLHCTTIAAW